MVPREHLGSARALIGRLRTASLAFETASLPLIRGLRAQWQEARHHKVQPDDLLHFALGWRDKVPSEGRVGEYKLETKRRALSLAESRIFSSDQYYRSWLEGEREQALVLQVLLVTCTPQTFRCDTDTVASVCLHAVARRLERGNDASEQAVLADIAALVHSVTSEREFKISVPSGVWVGERIPAKLGDDSVQRDVLVVRTFIDQAYLASAAE